MKWEDLLIRSTQKTGTIERTKMPTLKLDPTAPPAYGPKSPIPDPVDQPVRVTLKEQVMGASPASQIDNPSVARWLVPRLPNR